jgi:hypothetical protein
MKIMLMLLALTVAGASLSALAAESPIPRRYKPVQFGQVMEEIEKEMAPGGLYSDVKPEDQDNVRKALGRMAALLEGKQSVAELSEKEKVALLNDQEQVNALLTGNKKEQLVCSRREVPGTHRHESVCETKYEAQMRTDDSRTRIREMEQVNPAYNN